MNAKERKWLLLFLILVGLVVGSLIGSSLQSVKGLEWINYGETFGFVKPLVLDLKVISITFGFTVNLTISSIIGMLIGLLIYSRLS
mgnify:CR=1 FL=1